MQPGTEEVGIEQEGEEAALPAQLNGPWPDSVIPVSRSRTYTLGYALASFGMMPSFAVKATCAPSALREGLRSPEAAVAPSVLMLTIVVV